MFHALRYLPTVPLKERKHVPTLGRWDSWLEAEDARLLLPTAGLLEVVPREDRS